MVFPADNESSKVVKPGEEAFDFPALSVAAQPPAVVERGLGSSATVRCQEQYLLFEQLLAQRIAIISPVGDEAQRFSFTRHCSKVAATSFTSAGAAASVWMAIGRP